MPIFIHFANLIIPKAIVRAKYPGGEEQFRMDNDFSNKSYNQEDDELFCIVRKFIHEFDIGALIQRGFDYDRQNHFSNDFALLPQKGKPPWQPEWLKTNGVFAWHDSTPSQLIDQANFIAFELDAATIQRSAELGVNLLLPIRSHQDSNHSV